MARDFNLHNSNAQKIWNYVVESAHTPQFKKTYREVQDATGVFWRTQGLALELIQLYCHEFNLPHLTAIVVEKSTGMPSSGCDVDRGNIDLEFARVQDFNWPKAPDSFLTPFVLGGIGSSKPAAITRNASSVTDESNYWLLQVNPKKWDIAGYVAAGNEISYWSIVNNKRLIKAGENFMLWQAGRNSGVLGWGCFTGSMVDKAEIDNEYWNTEVSSNTEFFGVQMTEFNLKVLLTREQMKALPTFSKSIIFKSPQSANAMRLTQDEWQDFEKLLLGSSGKVIPNIEEVEVASIIANTEILATTRLELVESRIGQGQFRRDVLARERHCRVTGTSNPDFLIASHIKPWRESSNQERLDSNNGLMLAPHVDRLFDKGWISFSDEGEMMVCNKLEISVLESWCLPQKINVGDFNEGQRIFLKYHRENIFCRGK